jgi:hypothetical protein
LQAWLPQKPDQRQQTPGFLPLLQALQLQQERKGLCFFGSTCILLRALPAAQACLHKLMLSVWAQAQAAVLARS